MKKPRVSMRHFVAYVRNGTWIGATAKKPSTPLLDADDRVDAYEQILALPGNKNRIVMIDFKE